MSARPGSWSRAPRPEAGSQWLRCSPPGIRACRSLPPSRSSPRGRTSRARVPACAPRTWPTLRLAPAAAGPPDALVPAGELPARADQARRRLLAMSSLTWARQGAAGRRFRGDALCTISQAASAETRDTYIDAPLCRLLIEPTRAGADDRGAPSGDRHERRLSRVRKVSVGISHRDSRGVPRGRPPTSRRSGPRCAATGGTGHRRQRVRWITNDAQLRSRPTTRAAPSARESTGQSFRPVHG